MSAVPITERHRHITVIRDDLFPGGTKARFLPRLFADADELVYASPAEGGAQTAIATVAASLGKRATIFVARRSPPHDRALMAKALGARIMQCTPGYLTLVQARARAYAGQGGARVRLLPFGLDVPEAQEITAAASRLPPPDEWWCAGGSGVLARALRKAWPAARGHVVQIGRPIAQDAVPGCVIHVHPLKFGQAAPQPPFPSDPHYDAKAWQIALQRRGQGMVYFWNVTGPAKP